MNETDYAYAPDKLFGFCPHKMTCFIENKKGRDLMNAEGLEGDVSRIFKNTGGTKTTDDRKTANGQTGERKG